MLRVIERYFRSIWQKRFRVLRTTSIYCIISSSYMPPDVPREFRKQSVCHRRRPPTNIETRTDTEALQIYTPGADDGGIP